MAITQITVDDVLERFPQFEGREAAIESLIPEVYLFVTDAWDPSIQKIAALYLMAHWLVTEDSADSLPVTSESLGPISVSYAAPARDPGDLAGFLLTEWGRRFLQLRGTMFGGPVVV